MSETNGNGHVKTLPNGCYEQAAPEPKKQLTPEQMRQATKEMRIVNRYRLAQIETNAILESSGGGYGWDRAQGFGGSDTTEVYLRMRQQAGGSAIPPTQPSDRRAGAKWPIWRTDVELNRLRQASRVLCASNDYAKGLLRNQTNYTIGKGFQYTAGPKIAHKPHIDDPDTDQATNEAARKEKIIKQRGIDKIVEAVQKWIDAFCSRNNWNAAAGPDDETEDGSVGSASSTRERETHWRVDRDGEAFIRLFVHADGTVDVRFVGPEMVWGAPAGRSERDGWSYGIQHLVTKTIDDNGQEERGEDLERIRHYYVRPHSIGDKPRSEKHDAGGEVVPAREMIHIKDPWEDAEVKRGTPVFSYDTFEALIRAANLQRNVSITSAVQAATAEIWKHSIGTKSQVEQLANGPLSKTITDGLGSSRIEQRVYPGMIRRVPAGQEPVPDPATTQVPNYLEAAQGDLRQAAASQSAPEFLVSGDASNGNFASISEAGVPYVRSAEARQEHFKTAFLRLMWRVVSFAVKAGALPQEALTLVEIAVEGMEIVKNNEGELAQARTQNLTAKVTSPQIECAKLGNDPKQVISDWKEWDKELAPSPQQTGPGDAQFAAQQAGGGAPPGGQPKPGADPNAPPSPGSAPDAAPDAAPAPDADPLAGLPEEDLSNWKPGADVQESMADVLEGLDSTGTGTTDPDSLGRVYHYVQHKKVKGPQEVAAHRAGAAPKPAAAGKAPIKAKVGDVNVHVVKKDTASGKAVVKAANGEHLVPLAKLEFAPAPEQAGKTPSPSSPSSPPAAAAPVAAPQAAPAKAVAAPAGATKAQQTEPAAPASAPVQDAAGATKAQQSAPAAPVVAGEPVTAPPPTAPQMPMHEPDPTQDTTGTGVADAARVGVPGDQVPPPPPIGRLPRLTDAERAVESGFATAYEAEPDKMAASYITKKNHVVAAVVKAKHHADAAEHAHAAGFLVKTSTKKDGSVDEFTIHGEEPKLSEFLHAYGFHHSLKYEIGDAPNIFATDDCKMLNAAYNPPRSNGVSPEQVLDNRSQYNTALHQTANAIAKRAFLTFLDGLPPEKKSVLVTSGGVAAGKGYSLGRVDQVKRIADQVGAIWDSAGEANSTENPWVLAECEKRGIKPTFLYVHSDPEKTWENPDRGVVERAGKIGRMVDARLFADSYTLGPKNFDAFHKANKDKAQFFVIDNRDEAKDAAGNPTVLDAIPPEALNIDADLLNMRSVAFLQNSPTVKPAVKRGGLAGNERIWNPAAMAAGAAPKQDAGAAAGPAKPASAPAPAVAPAAAPATAPQQAPKPAPVPKPGERAASAHAKYQELIAQAKQARVEAFNAVKADAQAAKAKASEHFEAISSESDNITPSEGPIQDAYDELDAMKADEYDAPADQFQHLKEIEAKVGQLLKLSNAAKVGEGEGELPDDAKKQNATRLAAVIQHARDSRAALKEYVGHRKEMKAIKSGEAPDVQESMQDDDGGHDWTSLLESMDAPRGGWLFDDFAGDAGWVEVSMGAVAGDVLEDDHRQRDEEAAAQARQAEAQRADAAAAQAADLARRQAAEVAAQVAAQQQAERLVAEKKQAEQRLYDEYRAIVEARLK